MKRTVMTMLMLALYCGGAFAARLPMPYPTVDAPVVHSGKYHILTCGKISVVLDGSNGMSIAMIQYSGESGMSLDDSNAAFREVSAHAAVRGASGVTELDQRHDPAARLQIIDQGPGRVAARAYFSLCSKDGFPYGSGTVDLYVYSDRVMLVPSLYIDYVNGDFTVVTAGLRGMLPGNRAELMLNGSKLMAQQGKRFSPFGADTAEFGIMVDNPGRTSMKIGWPRNSYPAWLYLNEIDRNPETEELYEKWPLWVAQRGAPLSWKRSAHSGLEVEYTGNGARQLDFLWLNGDSLKVADGGYAALNGSMGLFFGPASTVVEERWKAHCTPEKPEVKNGGFRYYNDIESVYEIDTKGGDTEVVFDNTTGSSDRIRCLRFWNLKGKGACVVKVNGENVPFGLYNDGDRIEDPMVPILKETTGPARFAALEVNVRRGTRAVVSLSRKPGMQLAYQMYSDLETYEGWTDSCAGRPLFLFQQSKGELYHATLPGKTDYAMAKLPLYWMRNGVNNDTFMNHTRGFKLMGSGPDAVRFVYTGTNLQGTGLSVYDVTARYAPGCLGFDIKAEFTPLDDGKRWTSVEYCDLYPFDNVYRRTFHYKDIVFLNKDGVFDRVGTGAWAGRFKTIPEQGRLSYYSEPVAREKGISRTPEGSDGTVWMVGNNPDRGNILYRRGEWNPSKGAKSGFALCNAWVDIHNTVSGRADLASRETISYTVEIFAGPIPPLDELNVLYGKAAGGKTVRRVTAVKYSPEGKLEGFQVK